MNLRVLLVEDNALNQELTRDLLEHAGHEVTVASDGAALRAWLRTDMVADVILLDVLLPDADGMALVRELRAEPRLRTVPVVAVTAQALAGDRERLLDAGFAGVLTKPIDTRSFVASIEAYSQRST